MREQNGNLPQILTAGQKQGGFLSVSASREMEEVKAAIFLAREFPRDLKQVEARLLSACGRYSLAEQAMYAYPRGNETITGPSIRLAEAIAQQYGNLKFGIRELRQENAESTIQAFAWDMETNVSQEKIFQVPHLRHTKKGAYALTDPRDIYELVANQGARRLRACILGVIPGDIVEACVERCEETLKKGTGESLEARIGKMLRSFADIGVTQPLIEQRLKKKIEAITETEIVNLYKVYKSIVDGMAKAHDFFDMKGPEAGAAADLNQKFNGPRQGPPSSPLRRPEPRPTDDVPPPDSM